jgi:hypothetical protein
MQVALIPENEEDDFITVIVHNRFLLMDKDYSFFSPHITLKEVFPAAGRKIHNHKSESGICVIGKLVRPK